MIPPTSRPRADTSALDIDSRRRIFELIQRTPGAHLREVQRAVELPYSTVEYHLRALERAELIRSVEDGNLKRHFAADMPVPDRALLGLLRRKRIRAVVVALLEGGELSHQDLAAAAGLKPPTLSYHLPRLEAAHVLQVRRDGRYTRVSLKDPNLMARVLVAHGRSFSDGAVDRFVATWSGFSASGPERSSAAGPSASRRPAARAGFGGVGPTGTDADG